jgi:catechol 2,3-dioxygenase-like lactoylglutathione lyase family enzyme
MLAKAPIMVTFSVDNLDAAKKFYGEVLGIKVDDTMPGMLHLQIEDGHDVWIYEKKNHVAAGYTLLNFTVDDLEKAMRGLQENGVTFEQYDEPGTKTDEHGVVDYGAMKIAFFNDPAGNNHAVLQMAAQS